MYNKLTIILPTEASLEESEARGLLSRWKTFFKYYNFYFDIEVYSCDCHNFSKKLNIIHHYLPFYIPKKNYLRQIIYNLYLLASCFKMSKFLRVISSSFFILPFLKLAGEKIILSYSYDYKTTTLLDFGGIKGLTAGIRERLSIMSTDVLFTTTPELKKILKARYNKKSLLISNFVDTRIFQPAKKENFILYAGRIHKSKGVSTLIKAIAILKEKYSTNIKLVLAGKGDIEKFKAESEKLKLKDIHFIGAIDNYALANIMASALIFVLPSRNREGHPKALIEAMASGCICIASNVRGNNNLIKPFSSGLLFEPANPEDLAQKVYEVLKSPGLRTTLCTNARIRALNFSIENTLLKEIALIKTYMNTKHKCQNV